MRKIDVIYNGWGENFKYGILAQERDQVLFEYAPKALDSGIALSPYLMPLSADTFSGFPSHQDFLPGFINDALPDGWGRLLVDRYFLKHHQVRREEITALQRLAIVGNRAMGALSFEPSDELQDAPVDLNLLQLAAHIEAVVTDQETKALSELLLVGGSPQGARPKALVRYHKKTGVISTDLSAEGEDWLIKFPAASEHPEVCVIEDCYAKLAQMCGLNMPETKYFDLGNKGTAFGIKRFDRADGMRVPLLTVAGALDLDYTIPNFDYKELLRLTAAVTNDVRQKEETFLRCVFNVVFNNRDDHTKNISFRMNQKGLWELSPAYDLTFCVGPSGYHQMGIMGEAFSPSYKDLEGLARDAQISSERFHNTIEQVAHAALEFKGQALNLPIIRKKTINEIDKAIQLNVKRLKH